MVLNLVFRSCLVLNLKLIAHLFLFLLNFYRFSFFFLLYIKFVVVFFLGVVAFFLIQDVIDTIFVV